MIDFLLLCLCMFPLAYANCDLRNGCSWQPVLTTESVRASAGFAYTTESYTKKMY